MKTLNYLLTGNKTLCLEKAEELINSFFSSNVAFCENLNIIKKDYSEKFEIESIYLLQEELALSPIDGQNKAYVIIGTDKISEVGQNKLLKTLEIENDNLMQILIAEDKNAIIGTIKSRTIQIDLLRPIVTIEDFIEQELKNNVYDKNKILNDIDKFMNIFEKDKSRAFFY